jgi:hypothetical protein
MSSHCSCDAPHLRANSTTARRNGPIPSARASPRSDNRDRSSTDTRTRYPARAHVSPTTGPQACRVPERSRMTRGPRARSGCVHPGNGDRSPLTTLKETAVRRSAPRAVPRAPASSRHRARLREHARAGSVQDRYRPVRRLGSSAPTCHRPRRHLQRDPSCRAARPWRACEATRPARRSLCESAISKSGR